MHTIQPSDPNAIARIPIQIIILNLASLCLTVFLSIKTQCSIKIDLPLFFMIIPIWVLYIIYAFIRPRPHIALICASLGSVLLNALCAAFLALIGLRLHAPLLDSTLAQADEFIGFNAPAIIKFCSFHPKFSNFLRIFYISCPLFPLVMTLLHNSSDWACCNL